MLSAFPRARVDAHLFFVQKLKSRGFKYTRDDFRLHTMTDFTSPLSAKGALAKPVAEPVTDQPSVERVIYVQPIGTLMTILEETKLSDGKSTFQLELSFKARQNDKNYVFLGSDEKLRELRDSRGFSNRISKWLSSNSLIIPSERQCVICFMDEESRMLSHWVLDEEEDSSPRIMQTYRQSLGLFEKLLMNADARMHEDYNQIKVIGRERDDLKRECERLRQECEDLKSQIPATADTELTAKRQRAD